MKPLKYKRVKKEITDEGERIVIERDTYSSDDGSFKETIEENVDSEALAERSQILKSEADKVDQLKDDINKGNFDKIEDKRSGVKQ